MSESIIVGGGCFWCVEAVFERQPGVLSALSGYAGGHVANPSYEQVCMGTTGHAEVVQIEFDPGLIPLKQILALFFVAHDPTTLNRQGADRGTQYRSVIYYADADQKAAAESAKREAELRLGVPVVTEIAKLDLFHAAEPYHQDYFRNNPDASYCNYVIRPKLEKLNGIQPG